jgi:hypothetical protein
MVFQQYLYGREYKWFIWYTETHSIKFQCSWQACKTQNLIQLGCTTQALMLYPVEMIQANNSQTQTTNNNVTCKTKRTNMPIYTILE